MMQYPNKIVIGIKGKAGVGKDTISNYLIEKYGFKKLAFATPVKEILAIVSGWPMELIQGDTPMSRDFRETVKHPDFDLTAREMLQIIGTELFRTHFDQNTWIKIAKRTIQDAKGNIVISDVRFPNEAEMIQEIGGHIFHIVRGSNSETDETIEKVVKNVGIVNHPSEQIFETQEEILIHNNGTLDELFKKIDELIDRLILLNGPIS